MELVCATRILVLAIVVILVIQKDNKQREQDLKKEMTHLFEEKQS